jgi:hypothetical protein
MQKIVYVKNIFIGEANLRDLMMTGEAASQAGCDRRTFKIWAEKLRIKPFGITAGGKHIYERKAAEKVIKTYKEKKSLVTNP